MSPLQGMGQGGVLHLGMGQGIEWLITSPKAHQHHLGAKARTVEGPS